MKRLITDTYRGYVKPEICMFLSVKSARTSMKNWHTCAPPEKAVLREYVLNM